MAAAGKDASAKHEGVIMARGGGGDAVPAPHAVCSACVDRPEGSPPLVHPSRTIVLSGAIAAGKTSMCDRIEQYAHQHNMAVRVLREPVGAFENVAGQGNLLELYYADPRRWALPFQLYALSLRVDAWRRDGVCFGARDPSGPTVVIERGLHDDHVFASVQRGVGNMSNLEFELYESAYRVAEAMAPRMRADRTVLLDTPYDRCAARMRQRARAEETGGDLDPGRAERLDAYYRRVHAATHAAVDTLEAAGAAVLRVPPDWSDAGAESHNATLARVLA